MNLFTIPQIAAKTGMTYPTTYWHCRKGHIQATHVARSWQISEAALELFELKKQAGHFPGRGRPRRKVQP
jgi:hypothetical protein